MDEQIRILKMIEEGKITAQQGAELLGALGTAGQGVPCEIIVSEEAYEKKMFRVQVDSPTGDKVNVQLPIRAVKRLLKATGKIPMVSENMQGMDLEEMMSAVIECLDSQVMGDIINVTGADGTIVKIFIS